MICIILSLPCTWEMLRIEELNDPKLHLLLEITMCYFQLYFFFLFFLSFFCVLAQGGSRQSGPRRPVPPPWPHMMPFGPPVSLENTFSLITNAKDTTAAVLFDQWVLQYTCKCIVKLRGNCRFSMLVIDILSYFQHLHCGHTVSPVYLCLRWSLHRHRWVLTWWMTRPWVACSSPGTWVDITPDSTWYVHWSVALNCEL